MDKQTVAGTGVAVAGLAETVQFIYGLVKPFGWGDMPASVAAFVATVIAVCTLWAVQWLPSPKADANG